MTIRAIALNCTLKAQGESSTDAMIGVLERAAIAVCVLANFGGGLAVRVAHASDSMASEAALARALPADAEGVVVNMLDQRVWSPTPHFMSYTLSKAGLWSLTQQFAQLATHTMQDAMRQGAFTLVAVDAEHLVPRAGRPALAERGDRHRHQRHAPGD